MKEGRGGCGIGYAVYLSVYVHESGRCVISDVTWELVSSLNLMRSTGDKSLDNDKLPTITNEITNDHE